MCHIKRILCSVLLSLVLWNSLKADTLEQRFLHPSSQAKPWIFWYWMNGAVTKEGITADLEAMKEIGLGGAYLMPIRDSLRAQFKDNCVLQGTPEWWSMVEHSMREADRLGLEMGMHICDGFALAGGPWITPEQSMQQVVYAETPTTGGEIKHLALNAPKAVRDYYQDVAVFALAMSPEESSESLRPVVTTSTGEEASYLLDGSNRLRAKTDISIVYDFGRPFTARSITLTPSSTNFQTCRIQVWAGDDGKNFRLIKKCEPARRGWQDYNHSTSYTIPETTARYFRFFWTPEGTEPGSEDLDAAKWKPDLAVRKIYLSSRALLENYEGKTGLVWRLSPRQTAEEIPNRLCLQKDQVIDVTAYMDENGVLHDLTLPEGNWSIIRMGHTSTGTQNDTGGGAKGLECDKFNADAVKWQFENWFGAAYKHIDKALLKRTLTHMHVDSWECGSQNFSSSFLTEFSNRRGYDLRPYMPLYAGIPIGSAAESEAVLADVRQTVADLVNEKFFGTLHELAKEHDCVMSAECVAPTMLSDGMRHYGQVDLPMGEYWLYSPTHDKPNDMFDAVSGAHIYSKNIVQAEGFTQLRALWKEYPGMLKTLGDFNFAFGMNKLFFHVFCHQPFVENYPGMTLDGIGLYMQRGQTWWPYASAWIDYISRCQALLQEGSPVVDIAVFAGENLPSRSILPDRLVSSLPGLFGQERVASESVRLANEGTPVHTTSVGVGAAANMITADMWKDPLRGYKYDTFNKEVFLQSKAENACMVLPGGATYKIVVFPEAHLLDPDRAYMSMEVLQHIQYLQKEGVRVFLPHIRPQYLLKNAAGEDELQAMRALVSKVWNWAEARQACLPYQAEDFSSIGLSRDLMAFDQQGKPAEEIVWNHRSTSDADIWFVANQKNESRLLEISLRATGKQPMYWDPLKGSISDFPKWRIENGRTIVSWPMDANASGFIVLKEPASALSGGIPKTIQEYPSRLNTWQITFVGLDTTLISDHLFDWSHSEDKAIRYYAGTARYETVLNCRKPKKQERIHLQLDSVDVIARVELNGRDCGILWTYPYRVDITEALKNGKNELKIEVANTWYNRVQAVNNGYWTSEGFWTNAKAWDKPAYGRPDNPLQASGLKGDVRLLIEQ